MTAFNKPKKQEGVTTVIRLVSGEKQNSSGNLETREFFQEK